MSQIPPQPKLEDFFPPPNPNRSRLTRREWMWLVGIAAFCLTIFGMAVYNGHITAGFQHTGAAAPVVKDSLTTHQPTVEYTRETSTGGSTTVKGNAVGPSMNLTGDQVSADALRMNGTSLAMDDIGSVAGGSFQGSFKASSNTTRLLQIVSGMLGLLCLCGVALRLYHAPPIDINHTACLAVAGIALIVGAFVPSILAWIGLGTICVFVISFVFPSAMGKAAKEYKAALADTVKKARAQGVDVEPDAHESTIAKAVNP